MDGTLPTHRASVRLVLVVLSFAAAYATGCSGFQGTTATSFLNHIRNDPDPNARFLAYQKLSSPGCYDDSHQRAEAVRVLTEKLGQGQEPVATRAVICRTLGELRDPAARDAILKAINDSEAVVRANACRALGKVGRPEDVTILARIMTVDTLEDCRIAAIEGIGELRSSDPRILQLLVTDMDHDDPAIRWASLEALRKITGKDLGVKPEPWRKFLQEPVAAKPESEARR
jgi:HEAT repeat protein